MRISLAVLLALLHGQLGLCQGKIGTSGVDDADSSTRDSEFFAAERGSSGTLLPVASSEEGPICGNQLSNCSHYPLEQCCGIYEAWAHTHCASHCGFCGVVPDRLCHDTIDYCIRLNPDLCTSDAYIIYRQENCAGFCKLCDVPWQPSKCAEDLFDSKSTSLRPDVVG